MDEEDEYEMVFEPDEALILALNEINDLKELIEEQNSSIEALKDQLSSIENKIK
tara:strand:+ start:115 stop:276 length:162 start_codon:yes stop_codon:yes gene_type:complete